MVEVAHQLIDDIGRFETRPDPEQDGHNAADLMPEEGFADDGQNAHGVRVARLGARKELLKVSDGGSSSSNNNRI